MKTLGKIHEEYIYVFSGCNDSKFVTCEVFDVHRQQWKEGSEITMPRSKFSALPISKSRILIFGGKDGSGNRTASIEEYNIKTNTFKTLPFTMPKPLSGF
jgi:hypothetical protein